ncbi:PREDICTED: digestive organ expansion factor homolog [Dufourea novaeangliae]|uniref:U3 small nucleolar RNA-associated protein 25 homolog n=1 Tax=Dufourea novaeangliae TaxID=178035 RepID=A0A154P377_DUFNO|nr:PREDICTED: digestive organ expansion factor homolog [Dufourea novaeangliae]KZC06385.1 Digestive organ expansion factor like protein [Dufourea novaeangliae]
MARGRRPTRGGKRPTRGGKRKFDRYDNQPKPKKGKFNLKEASYVREREAKNKEIEKRRQILEEEKLQHRELETDSFDEDETNPMQDLLSTFSGTNTIQSNAIESNSESDYSDIEGDIGKSGNVDENSIIYSDNQAELSNDSEGEEIKVKELDEEDPETAQEDAGYLRDPFTIHLRDDLDATLYDAVSNVPQIVDTQKITWPILGNLICEIPKTSRNTDGTMKKTKISVLEEKQFARGGTVPSLIETVDWNKLYVKTQIQGNITKANYSNTGDCVNTNPSFLTPLQRELFSVVNNYQDLYYPERTFSNADQIRFIYCLHAINHALKTRTKVLHHNAKISKSKCTNMAEIPDEYRDQGLVRPKILIIVPFRHACLQIVELLIAILIGEDKGGSVMNKIRFMEDFSGNELVMPKKNPKPEDYEQTFQGNTDDTFKIGISITKKTLKLYSEFYSSDIIISSLLGLRMLIGAEGEAERDYDFLASIELLILDQAEMFLMQNWDHMMHILNHLHLQPKDSHGTDFSRVRSWSVNGWSKYYRQTLIFSSIHVPEIYGIFNKRCYNYAGKVKVINPVSVGSICQVVVQVPQVFHRFESSSHSQALEQRMEFFVSKILPQYKDRIMNHTLIFVPSYFDFVKLRNYFKKEEYSFAQICEYSKDAKVARARDMFYHSDAHFLLYSERFHYYRRIRVKGIRHVIFYAPPTVPGFYSELCNLMHESNQNPRAGSESNMTVTVLYCKYDIMQLSAIVGTEKAKKMFGSEKTVHMLVTGE